MKTIEINNQKYEVLENEDNCLDEQVLTEKITDYFDNFDYIFGDYSYGKVRLKGFKDSKNKTVTKINDINTLKNYKKDYCCYGSKTFLIKKIK